MICPRHVNCPSDTGCIVYNGRKHRRRAASMTKQLQRFSCRERAQLGITMTALGSPRPSEQTQDLIARLAGSDEDRPKAAVRRCLSILQRGPSDLPFAAVAKSSHGRPNGLADFAVIGEAKLNVRNKQLTVRNRQFHQSTTFLDAAASVASLRMSTTLK